MIKNTLRSIRQKPKAVREQYAFWIACTLTSMIALVWVASHTGGVGVITGPVAEQEASVANTNSLSNFLSEAQEQISTVQKEVIEVLPTTSSSTDIQLSTTSTSASATNSSAAAVPAPKAPTRSEVRIATTTREATLTDSGE